MAHENLLSAQKVRYEDLRILGAASLTPSFTGVGASFQHPVRMLKVYNLSDSDLYLSFDGVVAKDIIPSQTAWIHDYCSNASMQAGNLEQTLGDRVYVSLIDAIPTNGKGVYVVVIYASTI